MNWLSRLYRRFLDRPDPSWDATYKAHGGSVQKFTGCDEATAVASAKRAQAREVQQRKIAAGRSPNAKPDPSVVVPMRKRGGQ